MVLMPVGHRTVLVGDPGLGEKALADSPEEAAAVVAFLPGGPDFTPATAARFETVADECRAAGYRVVRIPIVPGRDGRTYLTYVNAIMDVRDGRRTVYMPSYTFAAGLNRAAAAAWADLGYEVKTVECDGCRPQLRDAALSRQCHAARLRSVPGGGGEPPPPPGTDLLQSPS